jgi:hypothetical protein
VGMIIPSVIPSATSSSGVEASTTATNNTITSTRAGSRKTRVYVFREFLLKTYGTYLFQEQHGHQLSHHQDYNNKVESSAGQETDHQHQIQDPISQNPKASAATTSSCSGIAGGALILDVAGGKGDLSWLLTNVDNIPSVVMDPRPTLHTHLIKSINYLHQHPNEIGIRSIPGLYTYQPLAALMPKIRSKLENKDGKVYDDDDKNSMFVRPNHLQVYLDDDLVQAVRKVVVDGRRCINNDPCSGDRTEEEEGQQKQNEWHTFWLTARKNAAVVDECSIKRTTEISDNNDNQLQQKQATATTASTIIATPSIAWEALKTILRVKLIVGFHPDQATDSCFALAELLNVPYCIVPCCVFPNQFSYRTVKLQDGTSARVKTYNQLVDYLKEKYPAAQTAYLDFPFTETAKNLVLYTLPK